MIKSRGNINFSEPIIKTTKLGLNRLSVYNLVFKVNRTNNQFLSDTQGEAWSECRFLAYEPGAYYLIEIVELMKEETNGKITIEPDMNTMKCIMELTQGALSFDVAKSIASLQGFRKIVYKQGKYTSHKIIDIMGFRTLNIRCNVLSGVKDNGNNTDTLYTSTLTEPPGYLINIIQTNILYQNVTKDRIECFEFHIKDEHGSLIDFNGDVLSFTVNLIKKSS